MAYFNNAFNKVFLGTKGFAVVATKTTGDLTTGDTGFFLPSTVSTGSSGESGFTAATYADAALGCPLIFAAGSLYQKDKVGPFHGGYKESNKSKLINPKYVSRFYKQEGCAPTNMTISVGATPYTAEEAITCEKDFECDSTYTFRLDIKGSPVLRFLTRNTYLNVDYYTGCCPADEVTPSIIDPTLVYINWAKQFMQSPLIAPFIQIEIFDTTGASIGVYNKTTFDAAVAAGTLTWDSYTPVSPTTGLTAGMYVTGAYVDTRFGDCTFYPTDSIIAYLEPVTIIGSEVDLGGNPCKFGGVCVHNVCYPKQGEGFGESVLRQLILSERYRQDHFYNGMDLRIREITQGYDVTDAVNRDLLNTGFLYDRYYILHSVPRFNNPTGVFDNDQYLLEIVVNKPVSLTSTGANAGTTINVVSTTGVQPGMGVTITAGAGTLAANTTVVSVTNSTQFVVSAAPGVALDATTVLSVGVGTTIENFVNTWLTAAQGTSCVQLESFECSEACTVPQPA